MKALVIGATGAVGKDLVELLLADEAFERVDIFVRREVSIPSAKLVVHGGEWFSAAPILIIPPETTRIMESGLRTSKSG